MKKFKRILQFLLHIRFELSCMKVPRSFHYKKRVKLCIIHNGSIDNASAFESSCLMSCSFNINYVRDSRNICLFILLRRDFPARCPRSHTQAWLPHRSSVVNLLDFWGIFFLLLRCTKRALMFFSDGLNVGTMWHTSTSMLSIGSSRRIPTLLTTSCTWPASRSPSISRLLNLWYCSSSSTLALNLLFSEACSSFRLHWFWFSFQSPFILVLISFTPSQVWLQFFALSFNIHSWTLSLHFKTSIAFVMSLLSLLMSTVKAIGSTRTLL